MKFRVKRMFAVIGAAFCLLLAAGAVNASPEALVPAHYPRFDDDLELRQLAAALEKSLGYLRKVPASTRYTIAGTVVPVRRLIDSLRHFQQLVQSRPTPEELNRQIQRYYTVVRINSPPEPASRRMLITGYFQPVLSGSLRKEPPYIHPLYTVPENLLVRPVSAGREPEVGRMEKNRMVPFWTRREIENGNLLTGQELVWLKDPFDAFVLHVQGSGIIGLTDGATRGVHYARSNGREYRSVGKYLVDTGRMRLADVTMDSIRRYIDAHPEERDLILHQNDSFIFFHWSEPGPAIGNLGQELTPGRSVAADQQWYPPGALAYVDTRRPVLAEGQVVEWRRMQRFVSVQDTGSALTGPGRVDVFWGTGEQAGLEAGQMKEAGQVYLLLLNEGRKPAP